MSITCSIPPIQKQEKSNYYGSQYLSFQNETIQSK